MDTTNFKKQKQPSLNTLDILSSYKLLTMLFFIAYIVIVIVIQIVNNSKSTEAWFKTNSMIIIYFFALILFSVSAFMIYKTNKNKDDAILSTLPKSVQDTFNLRTKYTVILFIFMLTITILYFVNPLGIMTNYGGPIIFFTLFVGIVCAILIVVYQNFLAEPETANRVNEMPSGMKLMVKGLYILAAIGISGTLLFGALYLMGIFDQDASKPESWGHILFNLILFCAMLGIIYKLANAGGFLDKNPLYRLILNTLLYIPCLFINAINYIVGKVGISKTAAAATAKPGVTSTGATFTPPKPNEIKLLVASLVLLGGYFTWVFFLKSFLKSRYLKQGGQQFINQPIGTDILTNVASYETLVGTDIYDYRYAISFWLYIDAFPPSTNSSYLKVVPILSYGENPAVKYSSETNTLFITVKQSEEMNPVKTRVLKEGFTAETVEKWKDNISNAIEKVKTMSFGNDFDADGNRIIYKHPNVLLQKWNHIVLNYNGGTLDVFYNGKLVKSSIQVVPYITYDNLTVGTENGVKGNIANLTYFKMPLDILTINTLYTSLKDKNPPSISDNKETLIPV